MYTRSDHKFSIYKLKIKGIIANNLSDFLSRRISKFISIFHTKLSMDTKNTKRFFVNFVPFVSLCEAFCVNSN